MSKRKIIEIDDPHYRFNERPFFQFTELPKEINEMIHRRLEDLDKEEDQIASAKEDMTQVFRELRFWYYNTLYRRQLNWKATDFRPVTYFEAKVAVANSIRFGESFINRYFAVFDKHNSSVEFVRIPTDLRSKIGFVEPHIYAKENLNTEQLFQERLYEILDPDLEEETPAVYNAYVCNPLYNYDVDFHYCSEPFVVFE